MDSRFSQLLFRISGSIPWKNPRENLIKNNPTKSMILAMFQHRFKILQRFSRDSPEILQRSLAVAMNYQSNKWKPNIKIDSCPGMGVILNGSLMDPAASFLPAAIIGSPCDPAFVSPSNPIARGRSSFSTDESFRLISEIEQWAV